VLIGWQRVHPDHRRQGAPELSVPPERAIAYDLVPVDPDEERSAILLGLCYPLPAIGEVLDPQEVT
jgi:hypothetical protein